MFSSYAFLQVLGVGHHWRQQHSTRPIPGLLHCGIYIWTRYWGRKRGEITTDFIKWFSQSSYIWNIIPLASIVMKKKSEPGGRFFWMLLSYRKFSFILVFFSLNFSFLKNFFSLSILSKLDKKKTNVDTRLCAKCLPGAIQQQVWRRSSPRRESTAPTQHLVH